jgi:ABC-type multidrug transport system fused ATPase/permease subunit
MPLTTYQQLLSKYSAEYAALNKKLGWLSFIRLAVFIGTVILGYYYFTQHETYLLVIALLLFGLFFYCIRLYQQMKDKADFTKALMDINKSETGFLNGQPSTHDNGKEYINPHHPYSYDLDIFGEGSLYGFLNRTTTSFGKETLAQSLLHPDTSVIKERQESIKELSGKIDFRQHIQASGSLHVFEQKDMDKLKIWLQFPIVFSQPVYYYLLLIFPVATIGSLIIYFSTENSKALDLFIGLFILNFLITTSFLKKIFKQVSVSTAISKVLQQFAQQLKETEKQSFNSSLLQKLQNKLKHDDTTAAKSIKRLSSLFEYLDFIINPVMSSILNGLSLFHIHILFALDKWKKKNDKDVMSWLQIIGEFESLNSFANLAFNNPDYYYPDISQEEIVSAAQMGHPLIRKEKSVTNDISFQQEKFIVLTGSNMSGKSTFLRTLGINLVLARAGSIVCAKNFALFPFALYVSMRITDSLQDSESFFYAELKRLQEIIQHLQAKNKTFVMLDEILRGTNSNDKHGGTVGLIRKLAANHACGIIATHDLTVADLSAEYPSYMGNKCFESEIINGELVFDYKLKEGVCTKLNASFLMKKMGVID